MPAVKMNGVNAGHDPIKHPEHLRRRRRQGKAGPGHEVLGEVVAIFQAFARQEREPKRGGQAETDQRQLRSRAVAARNAIVMVRLLVRRSAVLIAP